ncbi:MAG: ZIP family metal transporter [Candidatus Pacearchaeota archaeon]
MKVLIQILIATFLVSLISLIGIITLSLKKKLINRILILIIPFAAGALIGGAFLHLIPEASEKISYFLISLFTLLGFTLFFLIEKLFHWRHCHKGECKVHTFSYLILIGDAIHNFIDGLIIAASFILSYPIGIASTIAIALHEIPQEIGDFSILVYGGIKIKRALLFNFFSALTAILGGIIGFFISESTNLAIFMLPIAAGGFIYIASSDLLPELRKEKKLDKSIIDFIIFLIGIAFMFFI